MKVKFNLIILFSFCLGLNLNGQVSKDYSDHVESLDKIVESLYSVISGDAGEKRDWDLFRYLFAEDAKLIPIQINKKAETLCIYLSPDDYITRSGDYLENKGFIEKEIYQLKETFGALAHVWTSYEAFQSSSSEEAFMRGINSIQLYNDGTRWWIVNISWFAETDDNPIPPRYLGN